MSKDLFGEEIAQTMVAGATNPQRRLVQHKGAIYPLIKKLRYGKLVKVRLPAYLVLAKKIMHGQNIIQLDGSIMKRLQFEILMETGTLWRIRAAETDAINYLNGGDPNCLNTQKRSHYRPKIKITVCSKSHTE